MRSVFKISIVLAIICALALYLFFFNHLTETELVSFSFIWLSLLIFGMTGKNALKNKRKRPLFVAVLYAIITIVVLFAFYNTVWMDL